MAKIKKIEVIAEIGWNFLGDIQLAKQMIKAAHTSGCTHAKFQTWSVDRLKHGAWDRDGRIDIYRKAELSLDDHFELKKYCDELGIIFMSSVFSLEDAKLLESVTTKCVKIPSFESRNFELISYCTEKFDKVYISVGTATWEEIEYLTKRFVDINKTVLMHCVSTYPLKAENANINRLGALKKLVQYVGYSDHMQGVESAKVAMEFDVDVIEKHFTTDNTLPGRDNKFACTPHHMHDLTNYIKMREKMYSLDTLDYQDCESDSRENYTGRFNKQ